MSRTNAKPPFYVIVNGREQKIVGASVSYEEIVAMHFGIAIPAGEHIVVTVTYRGGPARNVFGSLQPGGSVRVMNGMLFTAQVTSGA